MQSAEKAKMLIDTKLTEYTELRTELRMNMQLQWSILAAFFTLFGVLFVILFKSNGNDEYDALNNIVISCVGCFVLPVLGAATGVLWLDQVLRQMRIADYIYKIEEYMEETIGVDDSVPVLNWEHENAQHLDYKKTIISQISTFMNPNLFNYYAVLGILFLFPLFSFFLTLEIINPAKPALIWIIAFIIVYIVFCFLAVRQIKSILKHKHNQM